MALSTPGSRIPKWRSLPRNAYVLKIDGHDIQSMEDLNNAIHQARQRGLIKATCTFAIDKSYGIHPHHGIPQLYFDQLNVIARHLQEITQQEQQSNNQTTVRTLKTPSVPATDHTISRAFTISELRKRDDWPEWKASRYKMLDQYLEQGMFSDPMPLPSNANSLRMLWTYLLKVCGTRKSRMVCNGSPKQKGTVTLGHTYANSLEAASK
jgi:hypothetical protein